MAPTTMTSTTPWPGVMYGSDSSFATIATTCSKAMIGCMNNLFSVHVAEECLANCRACSTILRLVAVVKVLIVNPFQAFSTGFTAK